MHRTLKGCVMEALIIVVVVVVLIHNVTKIRENTDCIREKTVDSNIQKADVQRARYERYRAQRKEPKRPRQPWDYETKRANKALNQYRRQRWKNQGTMGQQQDQYRGE